jgi:YD repeat-containing protein
LSSTTKEYTAAAWVEAMLKKEGTNYIYTLPDQTKLEFNSEKECSMPNCKSKGHLLKETDRNGNAITFAYNSANRLETATDDGGRKLTFKYTTGGQVESITDPMGRTVRYAYESGSLVRGDV